ncbi:cytochrome P450 [Herbidospora mongoliensis]|uniref:cytochrome P450 n=1 Tax=Herbidospora mongoliensis TaxID=688067 RepID=UPI0008362BAF|nr:cytochrome P450 [Herbidospora mongoliensis]
MLPLHMRREEFDPHPDLTGLLRQEGLVRVPTLYGGPDAWLVTRYDEVRDVLRDPETFSNARSMDLRLPELPEPTPEEKVQMSAGAILMMDPPEHTRLRRMLTPEFTMRRIRRLEPRVTEIVHDHLDAMEAKGSPADLVTDFAMPVPSLVICELLGVPYEDRVAFQERTAMIMDFARTPEERLDAQREARAYMADLVARHRAAPGDDLLGMLIRDHGHDLSVDELIGIGGLLLIAGHETTANMLGLGTLALLRHPEQLARLHDHVDGAVEELMRYLSILHAGAVKIATRDVVLSGTTVREGEVVILSLPAANRDPAFVEDPDRFDIGRENPAHVAFGYGAHHCLGAPLARMEMRIAYPALFARFPDLRETDPPAEFRSHHFVYGLTTLPVAW